MTIRKERRRLEKRLKRTQYTQKYYDGYYFSSGINVYPDLRACG